MWTPCPQEGGATCQTLQSAVKSCVHGSYLKRRGSGLVIVLRNTCQGSDCASFPCQCKCTLLLPALPKRAAGATEGTTPSGDISKVIEASSVGLRDTIRWPPRVCHERAPMPVEPGSLQVRPRGQPCRPEAMRWKGKSRPQLPPGMDSGLRSRYQIRELVVLQN